MTLIDSALSTDWWTRLLRASGPEAAMAATLAHVEEAARGSAVVGLIDGTGSCDEMHSATMSALVVDRLPEIARALADGIEPEPTLDGAGGVGYEVTDGLLTVALAQPWPSADDVESRERIMSACQAAALGLGQVGLVHRERRRRTELTRLRATAKRIAASLDLDEVLSRIVEDAAALFGAGSGEMVLLDAPRRKLRVVAVSNLPTDLIGFEFTFGEGLSSHAILEQRPLHVPDYQQYEHRLELVAERFAYRSILCAPLLLRGEAIGALNVHFTSANRRFRSSDMDVIAAFADHAAIAIDHARRYENEVRLADELAAANEQLSRSLTVQARLTEQVVLGRGLSGITEELAALLDRPVAIQDHLWRPVAGAAPGGGDEWTSLVVSRPRGSRGSDRASTHEKEAAARSIVPIQLGADTAGYMILPGEEDHLAAIDRAVVEIAVSGVALEFAKLRAASEVEQRLQGEATIDLITGSFTSAETMSARAARLGYDLDEPRDLFVLQLDPDASPALEPDGPDPRRRMADAVRESLVRRAPGSMIVTHGESLVVLATAVSGTSSDRLAASLQQLASSRAPGASISVAIGDACEHPDDYPASFRLALDALDLIRKLGRRSAIVGSRQLGSYRLIMKSSSRDELEGFAARTLGPVLDHDRRTGGELIATLRAYVEEGFVQRRAAERLVVHVNTVVYRLRRISELLGVDLADPSVTFDLSLALRIRDVQGGR
ncbi:MAG: helix-turn-helix domain-containing protein [Chloroflexota bacterium]|nr:helix-turn-helix domain-containing protein [Chloroflexota bacterium]